SLMSKIVVSSGPDPRQSDSGKVKVSTAGPFVVGLVMLSTVVVVPLALLWSVGNDEAPDVSPVSAVSVSVPPSVPGCVMFCREDEVQHQSASSVPG
ncbi:hypothetical protein, partial [Nocardia cyriacigeorgica]|uniref:hypothetical protein n=1 Tax=Nocardia cyriacigeorgica TaxID=135487 RepID=UPI0013D573E1